MTMTGENRNTRRKFCFITTLSATTPSSSNQEMTPGLRGEEPWTNRFNYDTSLLKIHMKREEN
jgi:hypothetical protein